MHIFALKDTVLLIDEINCIQCRLCADNCPTFFSIYIHESFLNGLRIAIRESFSDKLQNSYNAEDNRALVHICHKRMSAFYYHRAIMSL